MFGKYLKDMQMITGINRLVYDLSFDYNTKNTCDIIDIHEHLIKK